MTCSFASEVSAHISLTLTHGCRNKSSKEQNWVCSLNFNLENEWIRCCKKGYKSLFEMLAEIKKIIDIGLTRQRD